MEKAKVISNVSLPIDFIVLLADGEVEAQEDNFGTVYANIALPGIKQVWHTYSGFPVVSKDNWIGIDRHWNEV
jgi:hypothetical protein